MKVGVTEPGTYIFQTELQLCEDLHTHFQSISTIIVSLPKKASPTMVYLTCNYKEFFFKIVSVVSTSC